MSEQNPNTPKNPAQGAPKQPKNTPNPAQSSISDGDRVKQSAKDAVSIKKHAISAGAAAVGLGGIHDAIGMAKNTKTENDATKTTNKPAAETRGNEDPALTQKKAGRRGSEPVESNPADKPPKPNKSDGKTAKGVGKAGEALGGGDLLKKSQSDGSLKGDSKEIGKGVKTGAALGTKIGGPVGTAVGAAAGGLLQGLKTKRGRRVIILAWASPFIIFGLGISLIVAVFVGSTDGSTRATNDRITSSVDTVLAEGLSESDIDEYNSIGIASGVEWQIIPAIAYQRENAASIDSSAMSGTGPGLNFMTWNICRDSCSNWNTRKAGIASKISEASPDILALEEGGWSNGAGVRSLVQNATGLTPVPVANKGQQMFYNPAKVRLMESGRVEVGKPYGATWGRFQNISGGSQFITIGTHLWYAKGAADDQRRLQEMTKIYNEVESKNTSGLPIVVMGDFNSNSSRDYDGPFEYLQTKGYENSRDVTLQDTVNRDYNSSWDRDAKIAKKSGYHVDSIFVGGGVTVNSWRQIFSSPVSGGKYGSPFITDHNALSSNLTLPPRAGGAAVSDSDETPADPVGPFGIDMNQVKELKKDGYPAISRNDAKDKMRSARYLTPLFASYLYGTNPVIASASLESGSEYAESAGGGEVRQEGEGADDQTDSSDLQEAYVLSLAKLPIENAGKNSAQIYSIARSWALGNQVCATNAANGFINDGVWSAPLKSRINSKFGMRFHPVLFVSKLHEGSDFSASNGTKLYAAGSGSVSHAGAGGAEGSWAGNWVEIDHGNGVKTIYAHMSKPAVKEGQAISAGTYIGLSGGTGRATGPHLHFQVHTGGKRNPVDPEAFFKERGVILGKDAPKGAGAVAGSGDTVQTGDTSTGGSTTSDVNDDDIAVSLPQTFTEKLKTGQTVTLKQFQVNNAASIVSEGSKLGLSDKGLTIAIMVALQESTLRNLSNVTNVPASKNYPNDGDGSDHDSVGLFQQRAGWGSTRDRMTPSYSARAFFGGPKGPNGGSPRGLLDIGWESMDNGKAAQTVQVSAFPDAYEKWESFAAKLVSTVKGQSPMGGSNCEGGETGASDTGVVAPSEAARVAIEAAKSQLGKPYIWGGNGPNGYDCSGLTKYAYKKAGITLPRLSYDQDEVGAKVSKSSLSPGDLVYWKNSWHVAMYIGDGKVIHAPRPGKNVEIVPLTQAHSGTPYGYSRPAGSAGSKV